jgi:hypothetical protein
VRVPNRDSGELLMPEAGRAAAGRDATATQSPLPALMLKPHDAEFNRGGS